MVASVNGFSQKYGIGGSFDVMNSIGSKKYQPGVSFFMDIPKTKTIALYGKLGYYFPCSVTDTNAYVVAKDPMTIPYQRSAENKTVINTFSLHLGTKYFVGNTYNFGFSGVFNTHFRILVSPVKSGITGYDASKYEPSPSQTSTSAKYTSIYLAAGGGAGVKYSQPWGTLFAGINADFLLLYLKPSPIASHIIVGFEVGYRRDIY